MNRSTDKKTDTVKQNNNFTRKKRAHNKKVKRSPTEFRGDQGWRESFFPGVVMTQHQCPTCGKHLDGNVRFCPEDGTPLTETAAASGLRTPHTSSATQRALLTLPTVVGNR